MHVPGMVVPAAEAWAQFKAARLGGSAVRRLHEDADDVADWVFVAHHKTGTTVGKVLAAALCAAAERQLITYTFREAPLGRISPAPLCHFLVKIYDEVCARAARNCGFLPPPHWPALV